VRIGAPANGCQMCRGCGGPHDAGDYNKRFWETRFFSDEGRWNSPYGEFFLSWYSGLLVRHADTVLASVKDVVRRKCTAIVLDAVEQARCCHYLSFLGDLLSRHQRGADAPNGAIFLPWCIGLLVRHAIVMLAVCKSRAAQVHGNHAGRDEKVKAPVLHARAGQRRRFGRFEVAAGGHLEPA
jgi:Glycosyl hydrolase family 14